MIRKKIFILLALFFSLSVLSSYAYAGEPKVNPYPVPKIKYKEQSLYADFFDNHIFERLEKYLMLAKDWELITGRKNESKCINSYDEVADSYFFTNRNGKKALSLNEIKRGANKDGSAPDMSGKWIITKGKFSGRTPGFFMKDSRGVRYLIKLDRKESAEMLSSCEIIGTKIFYAIGYNVPENFICYFTKDILSVKPGATYYDENGFKKKLTLDKVFEMLDESAYMVDGKYRAVASKILSGIPKGYVSFNSSRKEDKFDVVKHSDRRELRAYRVFSSWLNHHDARRGNTLDMLIEEKDGWYLKHYLIDFGSVLGSHNMQYKYAEAGHMYILDVWEAFKSFITLGFYNRPYYRPVKPYSKAVGYITADVFEPDEWKPMIPNYAFDNMTLRDAFWAAKIVASFTDEQIRAVVECAEYRNKSDEDYISDVLIKRRDKLCEYWFSKVTPLDNFIVKKDGEKFYLSFENLYKKCGFLKMEALLRYEAEFFGKDNSYVGSLNFNDERFLLPEEIVENGGIVEIRAFGECKDWKKHPVTLRFNSGARLAGIEH